MHKYTNPAVLAVLWVLVITSACTLRLSNQPAPLPTPAAESIVTLTPLPTFAANPPVVSSPTPLGSTSIPITSLPPTAVPVSAATQISPADFCADPQPRVLIDNFKSALQTSDGPLFASLISPIHGMEARLYRNGRVVNIDLQQARTLFDSTDRIDWGAAPSGLETKGSFKGVIVPALLKVLNGDYLLACDQVQIGGASYEAAWAYPGVNFYSVYFPGTPANDNLDWRTWLIGMEYVNGQPHLYAIMQFFWEP